MTNRDIEDEPWPIVSLPKLCPRCAELRGRGVVMHEVKKGRVVTAYECPSCDYVIPLALLDDEPWPIPVRHLTRGEQRVMHRALLASSKLVHEGDDLEPIRVGPPEPPGPPPRRGFTFGRPMVVMRALAVIAFVALTLFMCVPGPFGPVPG